MARYPLISRLIFTIVALPILYAGQPIGAESQPVAETIENQETTRGNDTENFDDGQLSQNEINSIAGALPEGEVKQMFKKKFATAADKASASSDEGFRTGEGYSLLFGKGVRAVSHAQKQLYSFFVSSTFNSREWAAALENINQEKGLGHLLITLFTAALLVFIGLSVERLVRRFTDGLRRQILDKASLGRLRFLGRVVSHLLLNILSFGAYVLTTFMLCALIYEETDPGYLIVSITLLSSYYIRFFVLATNFVLSPDAPTLRLFPVQDADAKFLYHWTIRLTATGIVIATFAYLFKHAGISQDHFLLIYGMSGLSVTLLLVVMIWRSRGRVAQAIWPGHPASNETETSLLAKIAKSWHFFAMLYVVVIGGFWFVSALAGQGAILELIISLFLIPLFIGLDQWVQKLLKIASGELPEVIDLSSDDDAEIVQKDEIDRKTDIKHIVSLIRKAFRAVLVAFLFFIVLRLWGIDLSVGRIFTHTVLSIVVALLLGFIAWEYIKTRIDRKLKEEMPQENQEMEEGGAGGSRAGTLLLLLRKFILSVLFVIVSLIILSSIGLNIGPLIAGAGVVGLAIGFGAQTLVKDVISGVFFLIDDAFRVGDYIETAGTKGMVEQISLRSLRLRHPRGMVHTIPFGGMGTVTNFSRDYIITKLDIRVRYDADIKKIKKIVKKINREIRQNEELAHGLLDDIKSQGVREMDDSAMILRVKFKTIPGEQFVLRREIYRMIQEDFSANDIEFAHRNVTVYLPPETTQQAPGEDQDKGAETAGAPDKKLIEASAAAAIAAQADEEAGKIKKTID